VKFLQLFTTEAYASAFLDRKKHINYKHLCFITNFLRLDLESEKERSQALEENMKEAKVSSPIEYLKPDGIISFDVPTSLYRSNANHDHEQPAHLRLRDPQIPQRVNLPKHGGPESRFCPARVYEYILDDNGQPKLQINPQNCLHCKACDIKAGLVTQLCKPVLVDKSGSFILRIIKIA
nr:electron transfer flavoprotein-ubiquinone oxidoreductase, mitochondrial isoform X1 [Tanacetum cinerariifolium]